MLEWLGPAATALGGILGFAGQEETNETNVALSRETRDWQERMANTGYQRAVKDLEAAGLNPALAYQQGGASTPGVTAPTVGNSIGAGLASAGAAASTIKEVEAVKQVKEQTEQMRAQTERIKAETMEKSAYTAAFMANLRKLQYEGDSEAARSETLDVDSRLAHRRWEAEHKYSLIDQDALGRISESERLQLNALLAKKTFSANVADRYSLATLNQLAISPAAAESQFAEDSQGMSPWLRNLVMLMRGVSSARAVAR